MIKSNTSQSQLFSLLYIAHVWQYLAFFFCHVLFFVNSICSVFFHAQYVTDTVDGLLDLSHFVLHWD